MVFLFVLWFQRCKVCERVDFLSRLLYESTELSKKKKKLTNLRHLFIIIEFSDGLGVVKHILDITVSHS